MSGSPHGNGTWFGPHGERLEGAFARGMANGVGVLRMANGDRVVGNFVDHKPQGNSMNLHFKNLIVNVVRRPGN